MLAKARTPSATSACMVWASCLPSSTVAAMLVLPGGGKGHAGRSDDRCVPRQAKLKKNSDQDSQNNRSGGRKQGPGKTDRGNGYRPGAVQAARVPGVGVPSRSG